MKQEILKAVAKNLQEFGYPSANEDNITNTFIFAMFAEKQLEEFKEAAERNNRLDAIQAADEILKEIKITIERES